MQKSYKQLLPNIKAFVFDIDGVLTNSIFQIGADGKPVRNLNSKDGYAMQLAIKKGYIVGIISGGHCDNVASALKRLGMTDVYMKASHKIEAWKDLLAIYEYRGLRENQILYMGDDIPDYEIMQRAGVACAPYDAVPEIRSLAHYVSYKKGGEGCARDVIEQTLKVQKNWMLKEDHIW
tara:strand:- start:109 stop:642 length:534 start_codon:yes stop_codon:yes gene_type:complete